MSNAKDLEAKARPGWPPVNAVLMSTPGSNVVLCSPIAGDPDAAVNQSISQPQGMIIGMLTPGPGILDEIHVITQRTGIGGTPSAVAQNVRWSVCSVVAEKDPLCLAGIKFDTVLATGIAQVAPATIGDVPLATGLALAVPTQFVIVVQGAFQSVADLSIYAQNCRSAGPLPGVYGNISGGVVITAAAYCTNRLTFDGVNPPQIQTGIYSAGVNDPYITPIAYKGLSVYAKWRKQ
ncbi:MAG: hypothetical protein KJ958_05465 [Gammaproteobacteria bacterium]|nr:hypothetical protein [Gammaproteobacteria bacterium]MBU1978602.1 hypothetical protein [Gammaproteobacteria bacterium]